VTEHDVVAMELPGGWVLLSPVGTLVCAGALARVEQYARRDGGRPSSSYTATSQVLRRAAQHARTGVDVSTPVAEETSGAPWTRMLDPVDTAAVAQVLGCTESNVRDLCRRHVFASAAKWGRVWLVERDEVEALAARRGRGEEPAA
jgi:hypothetical protein